MANKKEVDELLDRLLEGKRPEEVVGQGGLLDDLTKRLLERALEGELTEHLGYEKYATEGRNGGNSRNGHSTKHVKTDSLQQIPSTSMRRIWGRGTAVCSPSSCEG